jgi:hypothetical protein
MVFDLHYEAPRVLDQLTRFWGRSGAAPALCAPAEWQYLPVAI